MKKTNILKGAQDFTVIGKSGKDCYIYAAKPSLEAQKQLYDISVSNSEDKNIDAFQRCWKFDEQKGIRGSSVFLALRFDKLALRPNGLSIPGLLEAKVLEKQGKLENGVYRDYGITICNEQSPNQEIAQRLISQAKNLGLSLPLIVPFRALDYITEDGKVTFFILDSIEGVIAGKKAQRMIDSLDYQGNLGVQGLVRGMSGYWYADWDVLYYSTGGGRVDWICGEATKQNLERAVSEDIDKEARAKTNELNTKIANSKEVALKVLRS